MSASSYQCHLPTQSATLYHLLPSFLHTCYFALIDNVFIFTTLTVPTYEFLTHLNTHHLLLYGTAHQHILNKYSHLISLAAPHSNFPWYTFLQTLGKERTGKMMSAKRCAELFAVALANRVSEPWIIVQPGLIVMYLIQYFPGVSRRYFVICSVCIIFLSLFDILLWVFTYLIV